MSLTIYSREEFDAFAEREASRPETGHEYMTREPVRSAWRDKWDSDGMPDNDTIDTLVKAYRPRSPRPALCIRAEIQQMADDIPRNKRVLALFAAAPSL